MKMLGLAFCATLAAAGAQAQDPAQVDKPQPRVGDSRSYVVLDWMTKVKQREEDTTVTAVSEAQVEVLERHADALSVYDANFALLQAGQRKYSPPVQALQFPLQTGKTWTHSNSYATPDCGKVSSELKNAVQGWEDVTVPAGSFRALRVDSEGKWRGSCGTGTQSYKFWYVPQLRWLVRSESLIYAGGRVHEGLIRELTSFKLAD